MTFLSRFLEKKAFPFLKGRYIIDLKMGNIRLSEVELRNTPEKFRYRLFFIGDEDNDVEVVEVNEIDFETMKRRLKCGKNIFIAGIN